MTTDTAIALLLATAFVLALVAVAVLTRANASINRANTRANELMITAAYHRGRADYAEEMAPIMRHLMRGEKDQALALLRARTTERGSHR
jgi:hypothetical protein